MFVPSQSVLELVIRGSLMYLGALFILRILRREAGELSRADFLLIMLVADAAQNGMAGEYHSITEGLILVGTIFGWNYLIDWLSYRVPAIHDLMEPPPLLLVQDGKAHRKHLRSEMITMADLMEQLREQGVERLSQVKRCFVESDGKFSVIRFDQSAGGPQPSPS
jgi:uncharacterized membrane protein YcaP (DUF421 family)